MGLFKCGNPKCGCVENTALGHYWNRSRVENYDWVGKEHLKGLPLCSECAPVRFSDGSLTGMGEWHQQFAKEHVSEVNEATRRSLI